MVVIVVSPVGVHGTAAPVGVDPRAAAGPDSALALHRCAPSPVRVSPVRVHRAPGTRADPRGRGHRRLLVSRSAAGQPIGSIREPQPARSRVVVRIVASSRSASAVRVDHGGAAGADVRGDLHRASPSRWRSGPPVGVDQPALAGTGRGVDSHPRLLASAHRVDEAAGAGADAGLRGHRSPPGWMVRRGRQPFGSIVAPAPAWMRVLVVIAASWWLVQPCRPSGSSRGPSPARMRVLVVIAVSWWLVQPRWPSGSSTGPSPARMRVLVAIAASWWMVRRGCQPSGSAPGPLPARSCVVVRMARLSRWGPSRRRPRWGPSPGRCRRGSAWSLASSCSAVRVHAGAGAVRVHPGAATGADVRVRVHLLLRQPFGSMADPAPLGSSVGPVPARMCVVASISLLALSRDGRPAGTVAPASRPPWISRWGRCPGRLRRGSACSSSSPYLRSAVGVDARAPARADVRGGRHRPRRFRGLPRQPLGSSPIPFGADVGVRGHRRAQPSGSMPQPRPARTVVVVVICGISVQPLGSMPAPRPARTWVVMIIARISVQPSGSVPTPWPARTVVSVRIAVSSAVGVQARALAGADGGLGSHGGLLSRRGPGSAPGRRGW